MFRMNSAGIKLVINQLILPIVNEQSVANVTSSGGDTYLGRVIVAIVDGRPKCWISPQTTMALMIGW